MQNASIPIKKLLYYRIGITKLPSHPGLQSLSKEELSSQIAEALYTEATLSPELSKKLGQLIISSNEATGKLSFNYDTFQKIIARIKSLGGSTPELTIESNYFWVKIIGEEGSIKHIEYKDKVLHIF